MTMIDRFSFRKSIGLDSAAALSPFAGSIGTNPTDLRSNFGSSRSSSNSSRLLSVSYRNFMEERVASSINELAVSSSPNDNDAMDSIDTSGKKRLNRQFSTITERTASASLLDTSDTSFMNIGYVHEVKDTKVEDFAQEIELDDDKATLASTEKSLEGGGVIVQFSTVQIREYPICACDNPGGVKGTPISLTWEHQSEETLRIDKYENMRETTRPRRSEKQLKLTSVERDQRLRKDGYSRKEIQVMLVQANIARRKRMETLSTMEMSNVHEFLEKVFRGTRNWATMGAKKRKEREYLQKCDDYFRSAALETHQEEIILKA